MVESGYSEELVGLVKRHNRGFTTLGDVLARRYGVATQPATTNKQQQTITLVAGQAQDNNKD